MGADPDHTPPVGHTRLFTPWRKNPLLQLYVAAVPVVVLVTTMLPFSGLDRLAQFIAAEVK